MLSEFRWDVSEMTVGPPRVPNAGNVTRLTGDGTAERDRFPNAGSDDWCSIFHQ